MILTQDQGVLRRGQCDSPKLDALSFTHFIPKGYRNMQQSTERLTQIMQHYNECFDNQEYKRVGELVRPHCKTEEIYLYHMIAIQNACLEQCGMAFYEGDTQAVLHWVYWTFNVHDGHIIRDYIFSYSNMTWPIQIVFSNEVKNV